MPGVGLPIVICNQISTEVLFLISVTNKKTSLVLLSSSLLYFECIATAKKWWNHAWILSTVDNHLVPLTFSLLLPCGLFLKVENFFPGTKLFSSIFFFHFKNFNAIYAYDHRCAAGTSFSPASLLGCHGDLFSSFVIWYSLSFCIFFLWCLSLEAETELVFHTSLSL